MWKRQRFDEHAVSHEIIAVRQFGEHVKKRRQNQRVQVSGHSFRAWEIGVEQNVVAKSGAKQYLFFEPEEAS